MSKDPPRLDVKVTGFLRSDPALLHGAKMFEAMQQLVREVQLGPREAGLLLRTAMAVHGWQQIPRMIAAERGNAPPGQNMAGIGEAAAALLRRLDEADQWTKAALGINFTDHPTSFDQLNQGLLFLRDMAAKSAEAQKRDAGRPRDEITRMTLSMLLHRVDDLTGRKVGRSTMRRALSDRHLTGAGGKFITGWFKLIDPSITESALYHLLGEVRTEMAANPETVARRIKALELCELFAFARITPH